MPVLLHLILTPPYTVDSWYCHTLRFTGEETDINHVMMGKD